MRQNKAGCAEHSTMFSKIWLTTFQARLAFKSSLMGFKTMRHCIKNSTKRKAERILAQKENPSGK
jgi:hypothetical protein